CTRHVPTRPSALSLHDALPIYSNVRERPTPFFFVPVRQNSLRAAILNIRTPLAPQTMAAAIAREVHALDANLAPYEVITLQEQRSEEHTSELQSRENLVCRLLL